MKRNIPILVLAASTLATTAIVQRSITVASVRPGGCPALLCTTNDVTRGSCLTNWGPNLASATNASELVCATNASGRVQSTNTLALSSTNVFPEIAATNLLVALK